MPCVSVVDSSWPNEPCLRKTLPGEWAISRAQSCRLIVTWASVIQWFRISMSARQYLLVLVNISSKSLLIWLTVWFWLSQKLHSVLLVPFRRHSPHCSHTTRYDTRCYFNVRSTWFGLFYRTEPTTKNCKTEKLKSKNMYVRSNSKSLGNHM